MTSAAQAPILRPPPLHSRGNALPRLALTVPVAQPPQPPTQALAALSLDTSSSSSSNGTSGNASGKPPGKPSLKLNLNTSAANSAAANPYQALSYALELKNAVSGSPNKQNVSSSEATSSASEKRSTADPSTLDVQDLDDDGWEHAIKSGRIIKLGGLGEGAGGAVTRCRLEGCKTLFALKVITTDPNPEVIKQVKRELEFNKECESEWICKYYGKFIDIKNATISIAMEFCEGGSLDSVYREVKKLGGRTGEKVLGKIAIGVLSGLTYLSDRKIIHRDIKPSNILLCRNGQVKLCDFGVSGELLGSKGDANTFIGTSAYMAPERIQGQSYTITSDVWSLGVTLLEVAQNSFPFKGESGGDMSGPALLIELLTCIVTQPIPELKDEPELGIRWSDNFKYFISCCLEKNTSRRASPWKMLEHPWIVDMKGKKVNMERFLGQVWGWTD